MPQSQNERSGSQAHAQPQSHARPQPHAQSRPNFLFVLADDMGLWALGAAGNDEIHTPRLDRIARDGVRFENFFGASPVCSPARASILTGLMPSQHGVLDWIASGNVDRERMEREGIQNLYGGYVLEQKPIRFLSSGLSFTERLAREGYKLALSGKWHLGDSFTPQAGFDPDHWYTIGKGGACYDHPDIIEKDRIEIKDDYVTDLFTERALDFLEELKDEPFFLSVHYTAPHSPWDAKQHPRDLIELYEDCLFSHNPDVPDHPGLQVPPVYGTPRRREMLRGYYAAVTGMDRGIGRLLDRLAELGLAEQTYVIFLADNGMCMGHHGVWGKGNGTFPQNMYEESIKVPCLIRGPGVVPSFTPRALYSQLDLFPTILELAGIPAAEDEDGPPRAGRSFCAALRGEDDPADDRRAYICDEYGTVRMLRTTTDKYVHRSPWGPHQYFDLTADPHEEHNLFGDPRYADIILQRRHELERWFGAYSDPAFAGINQPVTGFGQLDRVDGQGHRLDKFQGEETVQTVQEMGD